jgi:hypothetical protein
MLVVETIAKIRWVCAPEQANDTAAPFINCSSNRGQNHGTNGNSGAKIGDQHKVEVITRKSARVLVTALSAALKDMCRINSH